jgi:formate-dependent nitrite reductase membrane component NrfD
VSYYDKPIIKPPSWRAYVPAYFFTGGLAGASAALVVAARMTKNDRLARTALFGATAGMAISPILLIADLRDPKRFMNMFRVFKVTSPMSVGSWLLGAFGTFCGVASASEFLGVARPLGRTAEVVAGMLGPLVSTYTAALIADTAVPIWHEAYGELPFLFAGGSIASAAGFALIATPVADAALARRLVFCGVAIEALNLERMHRRLGPFLAEPYGRENAALYKNCARGLTIAGVSLLRASRKSRFAAVTAGLLTLAGTVCERFSVFEAGKQSARDPKYVVQPQRERLSGRMDD